MVYPFPWGGSASLGQAGTTGQGVPRLRAILRRRGVLGAHWGTRETREDVWHLRSSSIRHRREGHANT